jgi:hypothetical protein
MCSSYGPSRAPWFTPYRGSARDPNLRVSDSERSEVADALSKHFADGRLDQAEFNERLDKAMAAKTRADLSGLLVDLPNLAVPAPVPRRPHRLLYLLLVVVVAAAVGSTIAMPFRHVPWLLVGLIAFLLLRHSAGGRRRWRA